MNKILLFILFYLIHFSAISQEQLTDLLESSIEGGSAPDGYVEFKDKVVFTAITSTEGLELWITDGTRDGTKLIKDVYPGATGSIKSRKPVVLNNIIYFLADNGTIGIQLWKSDGTPEGTVRVTDFLNGNINYLTVVGNQLFFLVNPSRENWEIWKSDGTAIGTVPVKKNITAWNTPDGFISAGGLFYVAFQVPGGSMVALWRSDGTEAGTFPVIDNIDGNGAGGIDGHGGTNYLTQYIEFNNELYFVARSISIFGWNSVGIMKTNGTLAGTVPVKGVRNGEILEYADVIEWQGKLYFSFFDADTRNYAIWETKGSDTDTRKVYEVFGNSYFIPSNLSATNTQLMFAAPAIGGGSSLITCNPISGQTQPLGNISNAAQRPFFFSKNHDVSIITKGTNSFFINAVLGDINSTFSSFRKFCLSDGTAAGTILIEKPEQINGGASPKAFNFNGKFYFTGNAQSTGGELWQSDGTLLGTFLLKNINISKNGGGDAILFSLNNKLLFNPADSISGRELWQSDGTKQGTALLKDIYPGKRGSFLFANESYASLGNQLIFSAIDPNYGGELWKTDGSPESTTLLKDLNLGIFSSVPSLFTPLGSYILFVARDENDQNYLWKTDGSPEGTVKLKDLGTKGYSTLFSGKKMTVANGKVFFKTDPGDLWVSDGTEAGTVKMLVFFSINEIISANNMIYFSVLPAFNGEYQLWKSDGTAAGTILVKSQVGSELSPPILLTNLDDKIVFTVRNSISGRELWKSDGTAEGTALLKDIAQGAISGINASPSFIRKADKVYFQANDNEHGAELWQTDGTGTGTILVKDILPGALGSYPNNLALINNKLYLAAYTPEFGMELWKSDGTAAGTLIAADVQPGGGNSNPTKMLGIGNNIFFVAESEQNGKQLWKLILKQDQQITFNSIATKVYEDAPFELDAIASSGLAVSFSIVSGPAILTGKVLTIKGAGQITVKASQAGDDTYNSIFVEQTFSVNKASQLITFSSIEDRTINETPIELVATSSSGLPVSFTLISGQATIVNNILTISEPGQIKVQATQDGNENYSPAPSIERTFIVSTVLGIEDELTAKVQLFPNPTSNYLYIQVPIELQEASLQIVNLKGQVVATQQINSHENIPLQVGQLPRGLYLLQIKNSLYQVSKKVNIY